MSDPETERGTDPATGTAAPLIELRQVSKGYDEGEGRRLVLDRVDARVEEGEMVALLGRSGSGLLLWCCSSNSRRHLCWHLRWHLCWRLCWRLFSSLRSVAYRHVCGGAPCCSLFFWAVASVCSPCCCPPVSLAPA